jgi:hypothetical protein
VVTVRPRSRVAAQRAVRRATSARHSRVRLAKLINADAGALGYGTRVMGGPGIVAGSGERPRDVSPTGWDTRLYWHWIFYNSIAFIALLTAVAVMVWLSMDVLDLAVGNRNLVGALLVATLGALLFGGVLGSLQWLVVRERVPVPRR